MREASAQFRLLDGSSYRVIAATEQGDLVRFERVLCSPDGVESTATAFVAPAALLRLALALHSEVDD